MYDMSRQVWSMIMLASGKQQRSHDVNRIVPTACAPCGVWVQAGSALHIHSSMILGAFDWLLQDGGSSKTKTLQHWKSDHIPTRFVLYYCSRLVPQKIRFGSSPELVYCSLLVHVEKNRTSHRGHAHVSYHDISDYNMSLKDKTTCLKNLGRPR